MPKTTENLARAFVGESQARNKYTMFSKIAKKEGYEQISAIFAETADQEAEHAKWFFRMLCDLRKKEERDLTRNVITGVSTNIGDTKENLKEAYTGEHHEYTALYPQFVRVAEEENHSEIAGRIRAIIKAEEHHFQRYRKLSSQLEMGTLFKKPDRIEWTCRKCGYVHAGNFAPEKCPSCGHPTAYFQVRAEEY